jgi:cobalamin biosynthesis protein CbiG
MSCPMRLACCTGRVTDGGAVRYQVSAVRSEWEWKRLCTSRNISNHSANAVSSHAAAEAVPGLENSSRKLRIFYGSGLRVARHRQSFAKCSFLVSESGRKGRGG